jgi:thiamine pyrophosphate-dependent acetolactate synthase large subunit-like protein
MDPGNLFNHDVQIVRHMKVVNAAKRVLVILGKAVLSGEEHLIVEELKEAISHVDHSSAFTSALGEP